MLVSNVPAIQTARLLLRVFTRDSQAKHLEQEGSSYLIREQKTKCSPLAAGWSGREAGEGVLIGSFCPGLITWHRRNLQWLESITGVQSTICVQSLPRSIATVHLLHYWKCLSLGQWLEIELILSPLSHHFIMVSAKKGKSKSVSSLKIFLSWYHFNILKTP